MHIDIFSYFYIPPPLSYFNILKVRAEVRNISEFIVASFSKM